MKGVNTDGFTFTVRRRRKRAGPFRLPRQTTSEDVDVTEEAQIKMKAQAKASKLGLSRCNISRVRPRIIIAETKPGMMFCLREGDDKVYVPRLQCLTWQRMLEMLESCEIVRKEDQQ